MSANPLAGLDAYCPRCFRLAYTEVIFCQFCGQFIHQNAPADSRHWDSRPPQVPAVAPVEAPAAPNIDLPEDALPYAVADDAAEDEAPDKSTDAQSSNAPDVPTEKTDTGSA